MTTPINTCLLPNVIRHHTIIFHSITDYFFGHCTCLSSIADEVDRSHRQEGKVRDTLKTQDAREVQRDLKLEFSDDQVAEIKSQCQRVGYAVMTVLRFGFPRKPDWICGKCSASNFAHRTRCYKPKCSTVRPENPKQIFTGKIRWKQATKGHFDVIQVHTRQRILRIAPIYFVEGEALRGTLKVLRGQTIETIGLINTASPHDGSLDVKVYLTGDSMKARGLRWQKAGTTKPTQGRELTSPRLAAALATGESHFTLRAWQELSVSSLFLRNDLDWESAEVIRSDELRVDDFIQVGDEYYKPAGPYQQGRDWCMMEDDEDNVIRFQLERQEDLHHNTWVSLCNNDRKQLDKLSKAEIDISSGGVRIFSESSGGANGSLMQQGTASNQPDDRFSFKPDVLRAAFQSLERLLKQATNPRVEIEITGSNFSSQTYEFEIPNGLQAGNWNVMLNSAFEDDMSCTLRSLNRPEVYSKCIRCRRSNFLRMGV